MTYEEICDIWPYNTRVLCETIEQRLDVTQIALDLGFEHNTSGYSYEVLSGVADSMFMHPLHSQRNDGDVPYINYHRGKEPRDGDITYEEFMLRVSKLNEEFECGELESLLI